MARHVDRSAATAYSANPVGTARRDQARRHPAHHRSRTGWRAQLRDVLGSLSPRRDGRRRRALPRPRDRAGRRGRIPHRTFTHRGAAHRTERFQECRPMKMLAPAAIVDAALDNPLTEDALALRFSERHAHDLRYVALKNQWYKWDGTRWVPEQTYLAFDLARASCRADAADYGNGRPPDKVFTAKTFAAVQTLARADRRQAATAKQFDADPWLFTAPGETIDLHSGLGKPVAAWRRSALASV